MLFIRDETGRVGIEPNIYANYMTGDLLLVSVDCRRCISGADHFNDSCHSASRFMRSSANSQGNFTPLKLDLIPLQSVARTLFDETGSTSQ
ncbi:hypothetical protein V2S84_04685 [Azotobacter chroococcum]|nr:hypothetical protein [Azotobacter chroococcum]